MVTNHGDFTPASPRRCLRKQALHIHWVRLGRNPNCGAVCGVPYKPSTTTCGHRENSHAQQMQKSEKDGVRRFAEKTFPSFSTWRIPHGLTRMLIEH
jgi:hypothetical protein